MNQTSRTPMLLSVPGIKFMQFNKIQSMTLMLTAGYRNQSIMKYKILTALFRTF